MVAGNVQARCKAEQSDEVANEQRGNGSIFMICLLTADEQIVLCVVVNF